jgi:ribonuclease P protein component
VLYACENDLGYPRLGLVASRKYGGATVRNQWKRRMREAFRLTQHALPAGLDLVVLPRGGPPPQRARLERSLAELAARAAARLGKRPARERTDP